MRYMIVLDYREREAPTRESIVDRDDDESAKDTARRWARLVSNAAGTAGRKPFVWFLYRQCADSMYMPFYAEPFPYPAPKR